MTRSPSDLVTEFCSLWAPPDPDTLIGFFAADAIYHNIPLEPLHGHDAIRLFLTGFAARFTGIDITIHRQVCDGGVVMNERTDVLHRRDGIVVDLPVMGVFEIADDRIVGWRDYFDLSTFTRAVSP